MDGADGNLARLSVGREVVKEGLRRRHRYGRLW